MGRISVWIGVITCLLFFKLDVQARDIQWFQGTVIFNDNQRVQTKLHLNQELGLLMVKQDENIRTYPAFKFRYVEYFDDQYGEPRFFMSLDKRKTGSISEVSIFEVVLFGEYIVMRKQLPNVTTSIDPFNNNLNKTDYEDMDNFIYYVYDGESILKLRNVNRRKMSSLTSNYGNEVGMFIKKYNLQFRTSRSKIRVLAYYNALAQCKASGGDC